MKEEDIGAVPVIDGQELAGIVTDRDIVVRCIAEGKDVTECTADEVMSSDMQTVSPDDSVDTAARIMADRQVRRLAVIDNGRLVGMVSLGDVAVKSDDTDLSGDTLEDVSKGVKQGGGGGAQQSASRTAARAKDIEDRRRMTDEQAAAAAQPFEAETEDLIGSHSGADKSVKRAGNQRAKAKQEKEPPPSKRQPQGLKSDSSERKQGIANRSAREENARNDKVIPFRRENEVRNTRVQKPRQTSSRRKKSAS
jgi:CBS-domain-containing membrane protein